MSETDEKADGAPGASGVSEPTEAEATALPTSNAEAPVQEAAVASAEPAPAAAQAPTGAKTASPTKRPESFLGRHFFTLIAVILVVEVFVYGKRGDIEICVGKDKTHDLDLMGQERTDQNRARFPQCEQRENLSMLSHYEEGVTEAKKNACRRATQIRNRGEAPICIKSGNGWRFRVEGKQVWPWDKRLWKSMFHLD